MRVISFSDILLNVPVGYTNVILDYVNNELATCTITIPKKHTLAIIALPTGLIKEHKSYSHEYLLERYCCIEIFENNSLSLIKELENKSGVKATTIPLNDENTLEIFRNSDTRGIPLFDDEFLCLCVLANIDINSLDDLIKALGLKLGTTNYAPMDLVFDRETEFSELLAYRDEIFLGLVQYGIEREIAFDMMEHFNLGKGMTAEYEHLMKNHNVPEWFIESCGKTLYLFPKAHGVVYSLEAFRFAWYKAHYPGAFRTVIEKEEITYE